MATSGSLTTSSYNNRNIKFSWSVKSTSIANNTTTINWSLEGAGSVAGYYKTQNITLKLDNKVVFQHLKASQGQINLYNGTSIASGTYTFKHNNDGSKKFTAFVEAGIYVWEPNVNGTKTFTLDTLPRGATITSAPNFTDEDNPTIQYNNPTGSSVASLQACVATAEGKIILDYRDISKTGSSYTFNFTDEERVKLQNACVDAKSKKVSFYLKTTIGDTDYRNYIFKTLTIANATPTLNPKVVDANGITLAITGDENKFVKYYSDAAVSAGVAAMKGATITSYKITHNKRSISAAAGSFPGVENDTFVFSITDSRGYTVSKTVKVDLIEYIKLSCSFNAKLSTDGVLSFTAEGNYYNGSLGATNNTLSLQYRYKPVGGTYSSWISFSATVSGNEYTASGSRSGLDYRTQYTVQVRATDAFGSKTPSAKTVSALPIFDWSNEDFNFNVPVSFQGNQMMDFVVEEGTEAMGSNGTWYWRKWLSGRAECYGCRNYGNMGVSTAWGVLYRSEIFNQSLPSGLFKATPEVVDITFRNSNFGAWIAKHETSAPSADDSGSFIVIRPASATLSQAYISFNIIGRWK